jgi:hypothetical protein
VCTTVTFKCKSGFHFPIRDEIQRLRGCRAATTDVYEMRVGGGPFQTSMEDRIDDLWPHEVKKVPAP